MYINSPDLIVLARTEITYAYPDPWSPKFNVFLLDSSMSYEPKLANIPSRQGT